MLFQLMACVNVRLSGVMGAAFRMSAAGETTEAAGQVSGVISAADSERGGWLADGRFETVIAHSFHPTGY